MNWTTRWHVVLGPGRSGSTILDLALSERGVISLGEVTHVCRRIGTENQLCGCGEPGHSCPYWSAVLEHAFGPEWIARCGQIESERLQHATYLAFPKMILFPSRWRRDAGSLIDATTRLMDAIEAHLPADAVIWDSSKSAPHAHLVAECRREIELVLLTRDPRAVAYSWMNAKRRTEFDNTLMPAYGPVGSSLRWSFAAVSAAIEALRQQKQLTDLVYENLCTDDQAIDQLADRLDPPTSTAPWAHAVGGNPVRWSSGARVHLKIDRRWEDSMRLPERLLAQLFAAPGMLVIAMLRRRGRLVMASRNHTITAKDALTAA